MNNKSLLFDRCGPKSVFRSENDGYYDSFREKNRVWFKDKLIA